MAIEKTNTEHVLIINGVWFVVLQLHIKERTVPVLCGIDQAMIISAINAILKTIKLFLQRKIERDGEIDLVMGL